MNKKNQVFEKNELSPNNTKVAIPSSNSLIQAAALQREICTGDQGVPKGG